MEDNGDAHILKCSVGYVKRRRFRKGIFFRQTPFRPWTKQEVALLGKLTDADVVKRTGRNCHSVFRKRRSLGISCRRVKTPLTAAEVKLLGKLPDQEVARRIGRS